MKWCCDGIRHMFEQRTFRSIFVFAEIPLDNSSTATFWIGMRSVNKADLDKIKLLGLPSRIPITINTRVPITYCPWCGTKLIRYYNNTYSQLLDPEISTEFSTS